MRRKFIIHLEGNRYEAEIEEIDVDIESTMKDVRIKEIHSPEIAVQEKEPERVAEVEGENTMKSPMPGTIIKILVRPGDYVKKGQAIISMEVMKMESEIMAEKDGMVRSIFVQEGDSVQTGDALIAI